MRVVTIIVFVNEMLLMRAGDVERNPGRGERRVRGGMCMYSLSVAYHTYTYLPPHIFVPLSV